MLMEEKNYRLGICAVYDIVLRGAEWSGMKMETFLAFWQL